VKEAKDDIYRKYKIPKGALLANVDSALGILIIFSSLESW